MNNFGTVYCYEVKKILSRKLTGIVFLICVCCVLLFTLADLSGNYYVDGEVVDTHYHMFQVDQGYRRALSGRALDQQLLEEMAAAYPKDTRHGRALQPDRRVPDLRAAVQ